MGLDQITMDMLGRAGKAVLRPESTTIVLTGQNKVRAGRPRRSSSVCASACMP